MFRVDWAPITNVFLGIWIAVDQLKRRYPYCGCMSKIEGLEIKSAQKWGVHMGLALCLLQALSRELAVCFEVLSEEVYSDLLYHYLVCAFIDSTDPCVNEVSGCPCFEAVSA